MQPPTLIVHGILDTRRRMTPLRRGLLARGLPTVHTFSLRPNDGRAPIPELADQVEREAAWLKRPHDATRIDIVGFSMGALIARYYIQRLGGQERVRRFISISGPHHGTQMARLWPLRGARDMRPQSALLKDLERDSDPFGAVEVHCIYTPLDLMIVPPRSSELAGARSTHRIAVPIHRLMVHDRRVLDLTARLLLASER